MNPVSVSKSGVLVSVHLQPRASRDEVCGTMGDAVKIRLRAPPVEGKANKALVEFLAEALGVPRRDIEIVSGDTNRNKRVRIYGVTEDSVRRALFPR